MTQEQAKQHQILKIISVTLFGIAQDDLTTAEKRIVKLLLIHEYLEVDGKGGFNLGSKSKQ